MLVQRHRQNPRVLPERGLHPVTVMHIHIDVRDPLRPQLQQPGNGQRRVVVDTEPRRTTRHRMVQPAREVHRMRRGPAPHRLGRRHRLPGDQRRHLMHPRERRIVHRPEPVVLIGRTGVRRGRAHGRHIVLAVHEPQRGVPGRLGGHHIHRTVEPVRPHQTHRQGQPDGVHRMTVPEVVSRYCVIPHQLCAAAHARHRIGQAPDRTTWRTRASQAPAPSGRASRPGNSTRPPAPRPTATPPGTPHS